MHVDLSLHSRNPGPHNGFDRWISAPCFDKGLRQFYQIEEYIHIMEDSIDRTMEEGDRIAKKNLPSMSKLFYTVLEIKLT